LKALIMQRLSLELLFVTSLVDQVEVAAEEPRACVRRSESPKLSQEKELLIIALWAIDD
jgi:hypothetical protein